MRAMILDVETLPIDAAEHREDCRSLILPWATAKVPPQHALDQQPPVEVVRPSPAPSTWKDPAKIAQRVHENELKAARATSDASLKRMAAAVEWWASGALKPHRARIFCASWQCGDRSGTCSGDERGLLTDLLDITTSLRPTHVIAWNAPFDAGMIFAGALRHGITPLAKAFAYPHYSFVAQHKLYGRTPVIVDAMQAWGTSRTKLAHACQILGIDHDVANPIEGSQVLDAYMAGRDDEIIAHCEADVRDLAAVWARLAPLYDITDTWSTAP